jgi:hypothetical protein
MSNQLANELPVEDDSSSDISNSSDDNSNNIDSSAEEDDDETGGHHEEHEIDEDGNNSNSNRVRSWVWNHYIYDKDTKKARCNYCKVLIATNKGSTSGMIKHAKSKHRITKDQNQDSQNRQLTLQDSINNSSDAIVSLLYYLIF